MSIRCQSEAKRENQAESPDSDFINAAVARMQNAPRFVSVAEAASYASYELNGGPVVSGNPEGRVPDSLQEDDNE